MPILINSTTFTDNFGNTLPFYKGNAGDKFSINFNISSIIRMTSVGNPLTIDTSLNQVLSPSVSWIKEGFRVGDPVLITIHNSGGSPAFQFYSEITYVDDTMCDFTDMGVWYDITAGQFISIVALKVGTTNTKVRGELEVNFNHIKNSVPTGASSLIDAEVSRIMFPDTQLMAVGASINGLLVGNQSGQFIESATLTRNAQQPDGFHHTLTIEFINSGIYDEAWFFSNECLKVFNKLAWAVVSGEPFAKTEQTYNYNANTGFFNEPNNSSVLDASLVTGVPELDYAFPTTFDIVVDGSLTDMGIGSAYKSIDDTYYRNKLLPQQRLTMIVPSSDATLSPYSSFLNGDGAGYDLEVNSIGSVGSVHTINITMTPNAQFATFMSGRDEGDRLFYLWIKCGNLNLLGFEGQLTTSPPIGGALDMIQDYGYLDHSENVTDTFGNASGFVADIEDDIAYIGRFMLDKNQVYESFTARLEAYDTVTEEDFTLQQISFNFSSVQFSNDGRYLLNETQNTVSGLQSTNVKRNAILVLDPTLDTATQYGVKIYVPWLLNWRYWIPKQGVSVDFYPNQNDNWQQYSGFDNWIVRTELQLMKEGLAYVHSNDVIINDYDAEDNIDSEIKIFLQPTNNEVTAVPADSMLIVQSTHANLLGNWDTTKVWGELTVEQFENSPRTNSSTVVPFDNNSSSPLSPITGNLIELTYPTPDVAKMRYMFDSSKIDLSGGVKFTAKIKEKDLPEPSYPIEYIDDAKVAYSFRKVSSDNVYPHIAPCIKVRQGGTAFLYDVYFTYVNGVLVLDVPQLLIIAKGADLYVHTLYDQSGNGNDAVQTIDADQALIVSAGVLVVDSNLGRPMMSHNTGSNVYYDISTPFATTQLMYQTFVFEREATTTAVGIGGDSPAIYPFMWENDEITTKLGSSVQLHTNSMSLGLKFSTVLRDASDNVKVWLNTSPITTIVSANLVSNFQYLGRCNNGVDDFYTNRGFSELIYWNIDKEADKATIDTLTNNFYGL